jgi:hypothetical protein
VGIENSFDFDFWRFPSAARAASGAWSEAKPKATMLLIHRMRPNWHTSRIFLVVSPGRSQQIECVRVSGNSDFWSISQI